MYKKNEVVNALLAEAAKYERIIQKTEKRLAKAPEGSVIIHRHGKGYQYYQRSDPEDRNGIYIPVSKKKTAFELIQKKYDSQILRSARKQLAEIKRFLQKYDPGSLEEIYSLLSDARKKAVIPAELPEDDYAEIWQAVDYEHKIISEATPEHFTNKGERVRSKSEVIIADALHRAGIPYRYECPLKLEGQIIHPDFTILRKYDKKEFYLEHLGMMDDTEYRNNALSRIIFYENNNIFPGDRLIITAETIKRPLNTSDVNRVIRHYLLDNTR